MGKLRKKPLLIMFLAFWIVGILFSFNSIPNVKATTQQTFTSTTLDGYITTPVWDANYTNIHDKQSATVYDSLDGMGVGQEYSVGMGKYNILRAFIPWDTSSIPNGANITEVKISCYLRVNETVDDFNVTVQNGQPTYPHLPIEDIDYYYVRYSGDGGQFNTSGLTTGYNNITLNSDGRSWISKTGITKLCLRSDREINSTVPTDLETVQFWTREKGEAYSPKLYVTYETETFNYIFHGLYNENTGLLTNDGVNVTAYFTDASSPQTFEVNGTYNINFTGRPRYFLFDLTNDREYWVSEDADYGEIYIFDDGTTKYTIAFLDLAGVLDDYPFVEAKRYINGTLRIVERRRVDIDEKIEMSLINGVTYTLSIQDGASYTYGDLVMTSTTTVQLTLKGIEFPKETLLTYNYVRIYAIRVLGASGTGNITITYQDTLEQTVSVDIYINYKNGTNIYNATETADSFSHVWASALNNTDYRLVVSINHARYGVYLWRQYFPRSFSDPPWALGFLGTLPFATNIIIPSLLILFAAGAFSQINAEVGAFMAVVTAATLTYLGWIPIAPGYLITAFTLAILMGLIFAKRRVQV